MILKARHYSLDCVFTRNKDNNNISITIKIEQNGKICVVRDYYRDKDIRLSVTVMYKYIYSIMLELTEVLCDNMINVKEEHLKQIQDCLEDVFADAVKTKVERINR